MFFAGRSSIVVHQNGLFLDYLLGQLLRIGDGGRAADELRIRSVKPAYPFQPSYHVGQMTAEDSPIVMDFVDNHESQILEKLNPAGVMRQDPAMKHIRIGDHHMTG